MPELTHVDARGEARMVDVSAKEVTARRAVAEGYLRLGPDGLAAVLERRSAKGDVLGIAQLAGIQAAKHTALLIPLCHSIPLDGVEVRLWADEALPGVRVEVEVRATWRTGVEMEALVAVQAALATVYDMVKAVDRGGEIGGVRLRSKEGGRSGAWRR
jgi:cyclic pyranopterin phosphate synthase